MPHVYTPTEVWPTSVTEPSDGDDLTAASIDVAVEPTLDRTEFLKGRLQIVQSNLPDMVRVGVRTYTNDDGLDHAPSTLNNTTVTAWTATPYWFPNPPVTPLPARCGLGSTDIVQITFTGCFNAYSIGSATGILHSVQLLVRADTGQIFAHTDAITRHLYEIGTATPAEWTGTIIANIPLAWASGGTSITFGIRQHVTVLGTPGTPGVEMWSPLSFRAELMRPPTTLGY